MSLMLRRGYAATSVDAVCTEAGVTKGSFFHYFESKELLGVEVLSFYRQRTTASLAAAPFAAVEDPLDRTLAYIDFLAELLASPDVPNACLIGNLTQEVAPASEPIRVACAEALGGWAAEIARDLAAAKAERAPAADFSPESVAQHFVAVFEGALVLSKAFDDRSVIDSSLKHFRAYVEQLFVSR